MKMWAFLLCLIGGIAAQQCPAGQGPVNCKICKSNKKPYASNDLAGLPRFRAGFRHVPGAPNLGAYKFCAPEFDNCPQVPNFVPDLNAVYNTPGTDPTTYFETLIMYAVYAIIFAVCSVIMCCCITCGRFCCDCCLGPGGSCGKRYPTLKKVKYQLGFEKLPDGKHWGYSFAEVWMARVLMAIFLFFVLLWFFLGEVEGNIGMTGAMKEVLNSPTALVNQVRALVNPVSDLVKNVIGAAIITIQAINTTFNDATNVSGAIDDVGCMLDTVKGLPNTSALTQFVDRVDVSITDIFDAIELLPPELDLLQSDLDAIRDTTVRDLRQILVDVNTTVTNTQMNLTNTNISLFRALAYGAELSDGPEGTEVISSEFRDLDRLPNATQVVEYTDFWDAFQANFAATGNASGADLVEEDFRELHFVYSNTSDFNQTAHKAEAFNRNIQRLVDERIVLDIIDNIDASQITIGGLNGTTDRINTTVSGLLPQVKNFSLTGIYDAVVHINDTVSAMPDFQELRDEIGKVELVRDAIVCMASLVDRVLSLNETVIELPDAMTTAINVTSLLNNSVVPALESVANVNEQIDGFETDKDALNVSSILRELDRTQAEVENKIENLNMTDLLESSANAEREAADIDWSIREDVVALNKTTSENRINNNTIFQLKDLQPAKENASYVAALAAQSMWRFQRGQCTLNDTAFCLTDPDCGSFGTCRPIANTQRCMLSGLACCDFFPVCDTLVGGYNPCAPGDECLFSHQLIAAMKFTLEETIRLAPNVTQDLADLNRVYEDERQANNNTLLIDSMNSAQSTLNEVDVDSLEDEVNAIEDALDTFDVADTRRQLGELNDTLVALDFSESKRLIEDLDNTFGTVRALVDTLEQGERFLKTIEAALFVRLPNYLGRLQPAKLSEIENALGTAAMLDELTLVADDMTQWLNSSIGDVLGEDLTTNLTGDFRPTRDFITHLGSSSAADGPIFWFFELAAKAQSLGQDGSTPASEPVKHRHTKDRMDVDASGQPYPDGQSCFTKTCLENYIDYINDAPLAKVTNGAIPIEMSRTTVIGLPYLLPIFFVLVPGVIALIGSFLPVLGKVNRIMTHIMNFCMYCQLPFIFTCAGIAWPLVMLAGDVCYGAENVGYQILEYNEPSICGDLGGNLTAAGLCQVSTNGETLEVDVGAAYAGFFGGQCGAAGSDPFNSLFTTLDARYSGVPNEMVGEWINTSDSSDSAFVMRQPLKDVFLAGGSLLSAHASTFAVDLQDSINCGSLHNVYINVKNSVCCDVLTSFYWALGSWYLIAWSYCLCGCATTYLAHKRFAHDLWGAEYKLAVNTAHQEMELEPVEEVDDGSISKRSRSSRSSRSSNSSTSSRSSLGDAATAVTVKERVLHRLSVAVDRYPQRT